MIDVQEKLDETVQAIAILKQSGASVPEEAFEMKEIFERCVEAERLLGADKANGFAAAASLHLDREAYEAYARHTGWKSLATGADLPQWDALPEAIRVAWRVSAAWVIGRVLRHFGVWK